MNDICISLQPDACWNLLAIQPASLRLVSTWKWLEEFCYSIRPVSRLVSAADGGVREEVGGLLVACIASCLPQPPRSRCGEKASIGCSASRYLGPSRTCTYFFILCIYRNSYLRFSFSEGSIQFPPVSFFHTIHGQGMNCPCFSANVNGYLFPCGLAISPLVGLRPATSSSGSKVRIWKCPGALPCR